MRIGRERRGLAITRPLPLTIATILESSSRSSIRNSLKSNVYGRGSMTAGSVVPVDTERICTICRIVPIPSARRRRADRRSKGPPTAPAGRRVESALPRERLSFTLAAMIQPGPPTDRGRTIGFSSFGGFTGSRHFIDPAQPTIPRDRDGLSPAAVFVLALVHPWRTRSRSCICSGHRRDVPVAVPAPQPVRSRRDPARKIGGRLLQGVLNGLGVIFYLVAVILCPPALLVPPAGTIVTWIRRRLHSV